MHTLSSIPSVYGPVQSWRFGRSLGIDPIGEISTCSFNCVYCQLGVIEERDSNRRIFVPTAKIKQDLLSFSPWQVDAITLSGSGEPTLALNLGDILALIKRVTHRPVHVLTNGTLLNDPRVRQELSLADCVAIKLDALSKNQLQRVNRPIAGISLAEIWQGLLAFRQEYTGHFAVQTMLLSVWNEKEQVEYIEQMRQLTPDEIQINTPSRPKPLAHSLEARGNHLPGLAPEEIRNLKPVENSFLRQFCDRIQQTLAISTHCPPTTLFS